MTSEQLDRLEQKTCSWPMYFTTIAVDRDSLLELLTLARIGLAAVELESIEKELAGSAGDKWHRLNLMRCDVSKRKYHSIYQYLARKDG